MMRLQRSWTDLAGTRATLAMAPGFTRGLPGGGRSWSLFISMAMIELKACPVAFGPIRLATSSGPRVLEDARQGERLGDGLDAELMGRIAHLVDLSVDGDDDDAEEILVDLGELGDVVRDLAAALALGLRVGHLDGLLDLRTRRTHRRPGHPLDVTLRRTAGAGSGGRVRHGLILTRFAAGEESHRQQRGREGSEAARVHHEAVINPEIQDARGR